MKQVELLPLEDEALHRALAKHKEVQWSKIDIQRDDFGNPIRLITTLALKYPNNGIRIRDGDEEQYYKERLYYTLPNGLHIAHQSAFQTNILYPEIFDSEVYLRHGITLTSGDFVFDVGANIGLFTLFVARKCSNNAHIYAFEPSPPTFEVLRTNTLLHAPQTHLCNYGLSDKPGNASLMFFPHMSGMSGLFSQAEKDRDIFKRGICNWVQEGENNYDRATLLQELDNTIEDYFADSEVYECQLKTFSSVIEEYGIAEVDLLKIDVERAELDVLLGIQEHDWRKIKQIVVEVHNQKLLKHIIELLAHYDFDMVIETEESTTASDSGKHDEQYRLYMVYAIQRPLHKNSYRNHSKISYKTVARPQLSVEEVRRFLQAKLPNYTLFGSLRNTIRNQCPEFAELPIEFIIESSTLSVPS